MERDSNWMIDRGQEDWGRMADHSHSMDDREYRIADLEIDMAK